MSDTTLGPLAAAARFVFGADHATAKALTDADIETLANYFAARN